MPRILPAIICAAAFCLAGVGAAHADSHFWDGVWFECEFASRTSPPDDGCAMLDDDGFIFKKNRVTYIKVQGSPETDACKKQRAGQCFRADSEAITVAVSRRGVIQSTPTTLGLRFLGCTQVFHMTERGDFIEARPDDERCFWAGDKHFYLRRYQGEVIRQSQEQERQ